MGVKKCLFLTMAIFIAACSCHPQSYDCAVSPWLSACLSPKGQPNAVNQEDKDQELLLSEEKILKDHLTTLCPDVKLKSSKYFQLKKNIIF